MRFVILPTRVILNILTLDFYITGAKIMQISSTFFLLIVASRLPRPVELPLHSSCSTIT